MTDLTDQDIETAREFIAHVRKYRAVTGHNAVTAVRVLEALMPAPPTTLAEELRSWAEDASYDEDRDNLLHAASRAEQIEQERDHFFREVENVRNWKEQLLNERDKARAEVERLDAVAEDYARRATAALTERDEARAEVERLDGRERKEHANDRWDLPLHRTEAGYPHCSTCDGGGCPDCTDPA